MAANSLLEGVRNAFTTASGCTKNWATSHLILSSVNRHQKNLSHCPKLLDHYSKFAAVPTIRLLARLNKRNEFLISSHHPLPETLIKQTGNVQVFRKAFLNKYHDRALAAMLQSWQSDEVNPALF